MGPSLFFAHGKMEGLSSRTKWTSKFKLLGTGASHPIVIRGDVESDLFQYYTGYSDSSGVLVPHAPISIADINDNDNFHQLCFPTTDDIVKISMMASTVEDPNQDPNLHSEIDARQSTSSTNVEDDLFEEGYQIYPNPFRMKYSSRICQIDGDNIFIVHDFWGEMSSSRKFLVLYKYAADENEYIPAMLTLTDVSGTHVMDSVGVWLKGNSSYSHPGVKKSFKIDFNKYFSGQNYDGLKKLNFSNGFKGPTCMREKLFFDACQRLACFAPRASFANVTFNGEAWGFYTVVEQIDDQFLDWAIEEVSGNLFKAGDNFEA